MIPPRLLLRSLLVVTVSSAVALAAHAYRHSIQHDVEAGYRRDLRRLETLGAQVDRELLRSRAGLVMHYDSLTRAFRELVEITRRVRVPPPELGFDPGPELSDALAVSRRCCATKRSCSTVSRATTRSFATRGSTIRRCSTSCVTGSPAHRAPRR